MVEGIDTGDFHSLKLDPCLLYVCPKGNLFCTVSKHFVPQLATKVSIKVSIRLFTSSCKEII